MVTIGWRQEAPPHQKKHAAVPSSLASGSTTRPVQVLLADLKRCMDSHRRISPICASQLHQLEADTRGDLVTNPTSTYFGIQSFAVAVPTAWNQLSADVRPTESVNVFKTVLKTFLFCLSAD